MDFAEDPIINAVHNGIKRGIRITLEDGCLGPAVILILSGIDTMAYISMPSYQQDVVAQDFVKWSERYIRFPCTDQLTGWDLYGARCAMLHSYGTASRLSREGKCREVGYLDESIPEVRFKPAVTKNLVLVSVPGLARAFFKGIDAFMVDVFSNRETAKIAEERLQKLVQSYGV